MRRRTRPRVAVAPGERILAWTETTDGRVLVGSRDAFYVATGEVVGTRLPWEQVEAADWDRDASLLRVSEVGAWGEQRVEHRFEIEEPGRLLELLRERVTASVVLQRHVAVHDRRGLRVIARRAPRGDEPIAWFYEYDEGIDPDDPSVRTAASHAFKAARDEVGTG